MFFALEIDPAELSGQVADIFPGYTLVVLGVVADLEAVLVQLRDLLPGHVVAFVGGEVEALGDEERRAESVLLEQRTCDRKVRLAGVVESQHYKFVGDRLERLTRSLRR